MSSKLKEQDNDHRQAGAANVNGGCKNAKGRECLRRLTRKHLDSFHMQLFQCQQNQFLFFQ